LLNTNEFKSKEGTSIAASNQLLEIWTIMYLNLKVLEMQGDMYFTLLNHTSF